MKYRMVNEKFWSDSFVVDKLNPLDRYLFLYFLTNNKTTICGTYELPLRIAANETGLEREEVERMLARLEPKIFYVDGWVVIPNFTKHQASNPNVEKGIAREFSLIPGLVQAKIGKALKPFESLLKASGNLTLLNYTLLNLTKPNGKAKAIVIDKRNPEVTQLISHFETSIGKMPRASQQVFSATSLLKQHGLDKTIGAINAASACRGEPYAPSIASLEELADKWVKLENFYHRKVKPKGAKIR